MSLASRALRIVSKTILAVICLVVVGTAVLFLALRREETRVSLANRLLARLSLSGVQLTIEGIGGAASGAIGIRGIRLTRADSTFAQIDTLLVKGDALRFLAGDSRLDELSIVSARADFAALRSAFASRSTADSNQKSPSKFRLDVRRARLRDVELEHAAFPDSGERHVSIQTIERFDGRVSIAGEGLEIEADTLEARGRLVSTDSLDVALTAKGSWKTGTIDAESIVIRTAKSAIDARGSASFDENGFNFRGAQLEATVHPLDAEDTRRLGVSALERGRLTGDVRLDDGKASGRARFEADSGSVDVSRYTIDLRDLPRWNGTCTLGPSSWKGRKLTTAEVEASASAQTITVHADAESPGGALRLEADITNPGRDALFEIRDAVFRRVDLAEWTKSPQLVSHLNGTLRGRGRGIDPRTLQFDGTVTLDRGDFAHVIVDEATIQASLARGRLDLDAHLRQEKAEARVRGTLEPWAERLTAQGSIEARGSFREFAVDSSLARFRVDGTTAHVDTLWLDAPAATARGSGTFAWDEHSASSSDFHLQAAVLDAAPLARLAGLDSLAVDSATLDAHVTGPIQRATIAATIGAEHVRVAGRSLDRVDGRFKVRAAEGRATFDVSAQADTGGVYLARGEALRTSNGVASTLRIDLAALEVPNGEEQWRLAAPTSVLLDGARIRIDNAQLVSGEAGLRVDGVLDRRGIQDFHAEMHSFDLNSLEILLGRDLLDGVLDGTVEVSGNATSPRVGGQVRLKTRIEDRDTATLTGTFVSEGPRLRVDGTLTEPQGSTLKIAGALPFQLTLAPSGSDSSATFFRRTDVGVDLSLTGENVSLSALEPFVDARSVKPREGAVTINVRVSGAIDDLAGSGTLILEKGKVELPSLGVTYEDVSVELLLEGDRAQVSRLSMRSGGGTLTGSGELAMSEKRLGDARLQLKADGFKGVDIDDLRFTVSGNTEIVRVAEALRWTGTLKLDELEVILDPSDYGAKRNPVTLIDADRAMLLETFGPRVTLHRSTILPDALRIADIDLSVVADRNAWIRQRAEPRIAAEISGRVQVKKPPEGTFQYFGELRPVPGRGFVEHFGRRFELAGGEILLDGAPQQARFNLESTYEVAPSDDPSQTTVVVTLTLSGTPADYDLVLSSEPALSSSEIATLIASGATSGLAVRSSADRNRDAAGAALQTGLTPLAGAFEDIAEETVGLDVFQIRQDGLNGATLVAGKYARPKLYVGLRQPVYFMEQDFADADQRRLQLEFEYTASRRLLLNLRGKGDAVRLLLRTRYEY